MPGFGTRLDTALSEDDILQRLAVRVDLDVGSASAAVQKLRRAMETYYRPALLESYGVPGAHAVPFCDLVISARHEEVIARRAREDWAAITQDGLPMRVARPQTSAQGDFAWLGYGVSAIPPGVSPIDETGPTVSGRDAVVINVALTLAQVRGEDNPTRIGFPVTFSHAFSVETEGVLIAFDPARSPHVFRRRADEGSMSGDPSSWPGFDRFAATHAVFIGRVPGPHRVAALEALHARLYCWKESGGRGGAWEPVEAGVSSSGSGIGIDINGEEVTLPVAVIAGSGGDGSDRARFGANVHLTSNDVSLFPTFGAAVDRGKRSGVVIAGFVWPGPGVGGALSWMQRRVSHLDIPVSHTGLLRLAACQSGSLVRVAWSGEEPGSRGFEFKRMPGVDGSNPDLLLMRRPAPEFAGIVGTTSLAAADPLVRALSRQITCHETALLRSARSRRLSELVTRVSLPEQGQNEVRKFLGGDKQLGTVRVLDGVIVVDYNSATDGGVRR
jgi:hypothetical protein